MDVDGFHPCDRKLARIGRAASFFYKSFGLEESAEVEPESERSIA
jgi:hypothetical protein